jgi:hypothetical protein
MFKKQWKTKGEIFLHVATLPFTWNVLLIPRIQVALVKLKAIYSLQLGTF